MPNNSNTTDFELSIDQGITDQFRIGQGINTITGERCGYVINYNNQDDLDTIIISPGQRTSKRIHVIESYEELKKQMSLSISASLGFGIFRSNLFSQYVAMSELSSYSKYIYIDVTSRNISQVLKKLEATDEAIQRANIESSEFFTYAGNRFVSGVQSGARLTAIIEIKANYKRQFENMSGYINVNVDLFNKGSISFQECLSRISTFKEIKSFIMRWGGDTALPDYNSIVTYADKVPEIAKASPWPIALVLNSYDTVKNLPSNIFDKDVFDKQVTELGELERCLSKHVQVKSDLLAIQQKPNKFEYAGNLLGDIAGKLEEVENIITFLKSKAREISRHPEIEFDGCPALTKLLPMPTLKDVTPVQVFEHINFGGDIRRFDESTSFVGDKWNDRISSLKVAAGFKAIFYQHIDYSGAFIEVVGPREISNLHEVLKTPVTMPFLTWGDQISSIRIIEF